MRQDRPPDAARSPRRGHATVRRSTYRRPWVPGTAARRRRCRRSCSRTFPLTSPTL